MTYAAHGQRRRGRQPRISRDRIVEAAYEIGIEQLTMAAVAERLGVTHQSLYGWVSDRDELIDLVSDQLIRRLEILRPALSTHRRDALRSYANGLRRLSGEMPGFAAAGLGRFRTTEGFARVNADVLSVLVEAGFDESMSQRIHETLTTALHGWLAREEALDGVRRWPAGTDTADRDDPAIRVARDELRLPSDDRFEFLVHSLLAGLPDPPCGLGAGDPPEVDLRDELIAQYAGDRQL